MTVLSKRRRRIRKSDCRAIPAKGRFVYFRIYGVKQEFLDRTSALNDFERLT